jgi:hypothetical protein
LLYNLPETKIRLKFDGGILKDKSTPDDEAMEDEDLIDLEVGLQPKDFGKGPKCSNVGIGGQGISQ